MCACVCVRRALTHARVFDEHAHPCVCVRHPHLKKSTTQTLPSDPASKFDTDIKSHTTVQNHWYVQHERALSEFQLYVSIFTNGFFKNGARAPDPRRCTIRYDTSDIEFDHVPAVHHPERYI